jgi:hypothetical protein
MTFDWSGNHRSSWTLALLIFLSLILHSAAFFFVHITTPERQLIPKTAQPVQLLTRFAPDGSPSPENEAVLRWIEAEDPAVVARVTSVEPSGLLDVPYRPSYAVSRTRPRGVPTEQATIEYPTARDSLEFIMGTDEKPALPTVAAPSVATEVAFPEELKARLPEKLTIELKATSSKSLESVHLLAGIAASGEVRFCFVQNNGTSVREMDSEMDNEALRIVSGIRLAPSSEPIVWAPVVVRWGSDAVTPAP